MTDLARELSELAGVVDQIATASADRLAALKTDLLGRKAGRLTQILRGLSALSPEERRTIGARANELRQQIEAAVATREAELAGAERGAALDPTMPARARWRGAEHPVTRVIDEICAIFGEIGFTRITGPEAETEAYNFTRLNIPLDHPAADMHDTFYLAKGVVLRTHTSPAQAHTMERFKPPIRVVVPGLCYRRDAFDPGHAPVFDQIEGLAVDEGITFVDFKAAIDYFVRRFFGPTVVTRFRPSFFPFTEPSAEVDVQCQVCKGSGCATCKQTGFLEIMGSGLVHPAVFTNCGLDAEKYTGWAFGMGPGRIAMLRHAIPDYRLLYETDMRVLGQFA